MNEALLVKKARSDPDAFADLYRRYQHAVYRYVLSRTGNRADAEDLTAQTFLAAYESLAHYSQRGSFKAWLIGIARNKTAAYFRSYPPALPLDEAVPSNDPSIEDTIAQRFQLDQVVQALRTMNVDRAEALTLRVFGGLSAAEAGEVLNKSEDAINMMVYRAMNELRARLVIPEVER